MITSLFDSHRLVLFIQLQFGTTKVIAKPKKERKGKIKSEKEREREKVKRNLYPRFFHEAVFNQDALHFSSVPLCVCVC